MKRMTKDGGKLGGRELRQKYGKNICQLKKSNIYQRHQNDVT